METFDRLEDFAGPSAAASVVGIRFYMDAIHSEAKSRSAGRPIFEDAEMIEIQIPGSRDLQRRPVTDEDRAHYAAKYQRFKAGQDQVASDGLPLREWPLVTRATVEELAFFGIRTVEQLAHMPDGNASQVGPIASLRQKAKDWLASAKSSTGLAKLRDENLDLRKRVETLEKMLAAASSELAASRGETRQAAPALDLDAITAAIEAKLAAKMTAPAIGTNGAVPKRRGRPPGSKNKPKVVLPTET